MDNSGPDVQMEQGTPNGHVQPVSPLERVLLRNIPELANELKDVINAFDPWACGRGDYYSLMETAARSRIRSGFQELANYV